MATAEVSEAEIYARIEAILVDRLEVPKAAVRPGASLGGDLDLDSIDAVDLIAYIAEWTGRRPTREQLAAVRTVSDVVELTRKTLSRSSS